ncbi:MLO-like protein 13 isoform X2 [Macadamia integrifolia]|uniref:MLO-like protein 13 isoform X2 n=1 Tax=Macadamia integrifolia TaxID=60698 RepID=UPI001C4F2B03|nr:MLO-like protein 13 isoform X2 [Macadamia integrifolia]
MAASIAAGQEMAVEANSLEYTPTWVVAAVCTVIVFISLCAERLLHRLGKCLKHKQQDALFEALQKLKEELMLLGFISLLLTVFQGLISNICISRNFASNMLPCKENRLFSLGAKPKGRRLLAEASNSVQCAKGKVQLLSLEALHQLHIFIFVLAVVHVIFCATTMVLGGAKIRQWKHWEDSIRHETGKQRQVSTTLNPGHGHHNLDFVKQRAMGFWRKSAVVGWIMSFFKQFYGSVTKSDYAAMRLGFIMNFDFHKYMMRTLEIDFKRVVGISWYLWLFVVIFLLLNVEGWHTYFWLSFLPLILLLLVGAKLEHIITRLAEEVEERRTDDPRAPPVKPSDKHFWFGRPGIVLYLIHFILFQNSFEIGFFFWIWCTYGLHSCIMEKVGYIIPRLILGVVVQVLCSYSTLPLYAIVTQMGSMFKLQGLFDEHMEGRMEALQSWVEEGKRKKKRPLWKIFSHQRTEGEQSHSIQMQAMANHTVRDTSIAEDPEFVVDIITTSEHSNSKQTQNLS